MWLSPSGQVAHTTLDWRLCRTRIFNLYINDLITLEEYKTDKAEYTAQLAAFSAAPEPIKDLSGLRSFLTLDIDAVYSSMSPEERRYLWRSIIREIRVDEKGNIK